MDCDDKEAVIKRYGERYRTFGYDPRTLGWTKGKEKLRYKILLDRWRVGGCGSVLDVGCGFGDMYAYCMQSGFGRWKYTGVDLVPELIAEGKVRFPDADLRVLDMDLEPLPTGYDVVVASGVFSHILKDNYAFIETCFSRFFESSKVGFAANFMSTTADIRPNHLFFANPSLILEIAHRFSKRVCLLHDYMPFEFTVHVFKNDQFSPSSVVFESYEKYIDRI